ncbi:beta-lactamase family protein [Stieleria sp. ICT_E10.1]|uniref:serine hydrolase domain-containing protein n=1 Tax=Stieleria sedimenti TaxID=2976331 RepID=UPI00217FC1FC|nr:serine hydrolase domain-containing protein [Stieleria sedimenti]MCS7468588.1 beta-lactamase family protein [Stieleria sedimenti]
MKHTARLACVSLLLSILFLVALPGHRCLGQINEAPSNTEATKPDVPLAERRRQERREFQSQELMLAKSGSWFFKPGETPRILWRDAETVRLLGCKQPLRVRWFDATLREAESPDAPGRWLAWIEGIAPNGTPLRRSLTFYGLPKQITGSFSPDLTVAFPNFPGPKAPTVVVEHEAEIIRLANDIVVKAVLNSEKGAILVAGITEAKPHGRPARYVESAAVMNDDCHLALKLKVQGLQDNVRRLRPPRRRDQPATRLHQGTAAEAGVMPDAKARIDAVCRAWAEDTAEPFVTLVARRGVIITHEAFGCDASGQPIDRDYRCSVASITKTVTGILFSLFLDQGLIELDDSLATVFPDYPKNDPHVPTFRQCFNHTSGLAGLGEFGGMRNPQLENIVLNGIDVNQPGVKYAYSGLGFELAVKAMEIVAGQSAVRLYDEHLFRPLELGDVPIGNASSAGEFSAIELGILAQWVLNRGSYGPLEFIRPATFERLMPEPLRVADRGGWDSEGIGIHFMRHLKHDAPRGSQRDEDQLFGPRTIGHGSFSGCVFVIDPDAQLIITQVRKRSGPRSGEWSPKFFRTIAAVMKK